MSRHILICKALYLTLARELLFPRFPLSEPQTSCPTGAEPSILAASILGFSAHVLCALALPFWHGFSLLLGLYELTLLGSVPPEGCGGCSDRAPSSKAFGWSPEIFLTLAAISPWDGAWQETASRVRADY